MLHCATANPDKRIIITFPFWRTMIVGFGLCITTMVYGQGKNTIEKFAVQEAKIDQADSLGYFQKNKILIECYIDPVNHLPGFRMKGNNANISGRSYDFRLKVYKASAKAHPAEYLTFRWDYSNAQAEPETVYVQIWRVHKENKVTFECAILYRDFKLVMLTGNIIDPVNNVISAYKLIELGV